MESEDVSEEDTEVFEDYMQRENMVSRMIPKFLAQKLGGLVSMALAQERCLQHIALGE